MTTEQLYAAGMAKELPECDVCYGSGSGPNHGYSCKACQMTGRKGGEEAIKLHNDHKAELEHHWQMYQSCKAIRDKHGEVDWESADMEYHDRAIRRIAGYLGVE